MFNILYYIFICGALICICLRFVLLEISDRNEKFFDKCSGVFPIICVLAWIFIILAGVVLIIGKIKGVIN